MNKSEFEKHKGNLRIKGISFDTLTQMWEGANDEYDPTVDEPIAKFYIGKIGKYSEGSYYTNDYLNCSSICVTFANGYDVMVDPDDVEFTDEEMTWEEYLPNISKPDTTGVFKALTEDQVNFADKVFLQMIAGQHQLHNKDLRVLFGQAISMSQYRTHQHSMNWDVSWLDNIDEDN